MNKVLVTGGAGYVGSHVCKRLKSNGFVPVTLDNLASGWREAVKFGPFAHADILERRDLESAFLQWDPIAVIHLAALTSVEDSVLRPDEYRLCNVEGTRILLEVMAVHGCRVLIFSSTCAVYGNVPSDSVSEETPARPESPYADSKLAAEKILLRYSEQCDIRSTVFRCFNVAGADPDGEIGEFKQSPSNLIPVVLECASGKRSQLQIFGADYPTPDGTCVRDYVHAVDVADAHVKGLHAILEGGKGSCYNVGSGTGCSVREIAECCRKITKMNVPVLESERRPGDIASIVSDCRKARAAFAWSPDNSPIEQIIGDAWNWMSEGGYEQG